MGINSVNGQELAALFKLRASLTPAPGLRTKEAEPDRPEATMQRRPDKNEEQEQRAARSVTPSSLEITRRAFRFDADTKRIVVQVIAENNEVIKQIPPEEFLRMAARLRQVQGLLFDERA